jgi:hypothetical protein
MQDNRISLTRDCYLRALREAVMEVPQPWAADVRRTRYIGDFRDWQQHAAYRSAFARLLRDLKASV